MTTSAPTAVPPLDRLRSLALQTLLGGVAGVAAGGTYAFLHGQPALFLASAYGVNATLFTGAFLAVRTVVLDVGVRAAPATWRAPITLEPIASALAGAIVGAGATALVASRRPGRIAAGAALWAAVGAGGDSAIDAVRSWRSRGRARVEEADRLWRALGPTERARVWAELGAVPQPTPPRPTADALAALRRVAAQSGIVVTSPASTKDKGGESGATPAPAAGIDWSWLPIHVGVNADEVRLKRLRSRAAEIDEVLARGESSAAASEGSAGGARDGSLR